MTMRPLMAGLAVILLASWHSCLPAQAPTTLKGNPLAGVIDFHVHSGPDSFTRSISDVEIARIARANKMGALVLKNHFTMTADRAWLAERLTGQRCYGGIVLNRAVGGLNVAAIERMLTFTGDRGKVIWLPTFDAENHVGLLKEDSPAVAVVKDGKLVPELEQIFKVIAENDLVLETGHSSAEECLLLIKGAKAAGVKKIVVTHAMADPIGMSLDQLKQVASLGAKMECVWMTNLTGKNSHLASMRHWKKITSEDYARAIRAVGAEHFILSSDLGQYLNPIPTDGIKAFILDLAAAGFSEKEIDLMCRRTPARLLGMEQSKEPVKGASR
ncbi:MAG: DUF6282 family protein [Planctomycetota bacterium]|nr:DUF6282 family protein [Planctomycetota bacterium]